MKPANVVLSAIFLSFMIMQGCQGVTISSASIPRVENKALVTNQALNRALKDYVDKYLSEIIRIRNFNPERVKKVFSVHHTVYVETSVTDSAIIDVYAKLLCVEATLSMPNVVSISNLTGLPIKLYVQRYPKQERFKVVSDETPRDMPFYLQDLRRIFSNELMDRLNYARFNEKADYEVIRKKALDYYKNKKANCQQ